MQRQETLTCALEISVFSNQMEHLLAGFLAAYLTGGGWNKADLAHLRSPLSIVIGFSRRLTEVVLPEVYHFMGKGRKQESTCSGVLVAKWAGLSAISSVTSSWSYR
jgi:hypothetical protein